MLFFAETALMFSQNLSFRYEVKTRTGTNKESAKTEDYFFDISDSKSVFRSDHDWYYDSLKEKTGRALGVPLDFNQLYSRKDKLKNEVYKTITVPLVLDTYDIVIDEKLDWKLLSNTATIAGLKCQKAQWNTEEESGKPGLQKVLQYRMGLMYFVVCPD